MLQASWNFRREGIPAEVGELQTIGRGLVVTGLCIAIVGALLLVFGSRLGWLGRLPGDIRTDHVFIPLTTCLLVSAVGTLLVNIVLRLLGR